MKKVVVEVHQDASRPEGGFAVILLRGLDTLPDRAAFRLKPVEARGYQADDHSAWPAGDLKPLAVRTSESGVEIVVGPDIVDCPALVPGTLGVIEVRAAGVRGEFLWPSLRPTARPRRRNLTVVKPPARTAARSGSAGTIMRNDASSARNADIAAAPLAATAAQQAQAIAATHEERAVPITAIDHATPASASVAEAVGGNVVSFNVAREALASTTDRVAITATNRSTADDARRDVNRLEPRERGQWPALTSRTIGIAATLAVIVSGSFLFLGQKPDPSTAPGTRRDSAALPTPSTPAPSTATTTGSQAIVRREEPIAEPATPPPPTISPPVSVQPLPVIEAVAPIPVPRPTLPVMLRMRGGGFQISGDLKGYDGTKFVIETPAGGLMTLDAARFECDGEACARPAAAILPLSERPSPAKPDQFRIEGAPALTAAFAPQLIRDYAASIGATARELPREGTTPPRYRIADERGTELATIEIVPNGSAPALASLERGTAAIALLDRPHTPETDIRVSTPARGRQTGQQQPPAAPVTELVIGLDGIAVVAAPASAPGALSIDLVAKVFAGQITDWFELGRSPGPIQVYLPIEGSGTLETFVRQVMRPRNLEITKAARRLPEDTEVAEAVVRDPRGIGIAAFADQGSARAINLETTCGLIVRPTSFAVKTGEYPLVRRLSLQFPAQIAYPSARGIARIAQSGEVQNSITAARLVDPTIAMLPIEDQAERMAWAANAPSASFDANELRQMLTDLAGATRLSVTFRFIPGTNELDQRSRREIARLAAALREPELAGRRVLLAGFTDASGKLQANMTAAIKRSSQVRTALLQAGGVGLDPRLVTAKGYGPLAPVACVGAPDSTRLNRRVEVWVGAKDGRAALR